MFEAWVSFHAAISQIRKFRGNLGRTVVVLPLFATHPTSLSLGKPLGFITKMNLKYTLA